MGNEINLIPCFILSSYSPIASMCCRHGFLYYQSKKEAGMTVCTDGALVGVGGGEETPLALLYLESHF